MLTWEVRIFRYGEVGDSSSFREWVLFQAYADLVEILSRRAVRMSKLWMVHFLLATYWKRRERDSFWRVGESRGISSMFGSWNPITTNLDFAFLSLPNLTRSIGSRSFQVWAHLHCMMLHSGIWLRRIRRTVPVSIHWSSSFLCASSNSCLSCSLSILSFTSALWRLATVASMTNNLRYGCGVSSHHVRWGISLWTTLGSDLWFLWVNLFWALMISSRGSSWMVNTVTPVQGASVSHTVESPIHWSLCFQPLPWLSIPLVMRSSRKHKRCMGQSSSGCGMYAFVRGCMCLRMMWFFLIIQ